MKMYHRVQYLLLLIVYSFSLEAQVPVKTLSAGYLKPADLLVMSPVTTFNTEPEQVIKNNFRTLLKVGLSSQKDWLTVIKDTTEFTRMVRFRLTGNVRDLSNKMRINVTLFAQDYGEEEIFRQMYDFDPDSVLVTFNRISIDLTGKIKNYQINRVGRIYTVSVNPFMITIPDVDANRVQNILDEYIRNNLSAIELVSVIEAEEDPEFIITGSITSNYDSDYTVKVAISQAGENTSIFEEITTLNEFSLSNSASRITESLAGFFIVYNEIAPLLLSGSTETILVSESEKLINDTTDQDRNIKAKILLETVIRKNPNNAGALINLGFIEIESENYLEAEELFRKASELDPEDARAYYGLGQAYYYNYKDNDAKKEFKTAVRLSRNSDSEISSNSYYWLGQIDLTDNDLTKAIINFEKAVSINKGNIMAWYDLGNAYYKLYLEEESPHTDTIHIYHAIASFKDALQSHPKEKTFIFNVSYLLNYWGKIYYNYGIASDDDKYATFVNASYDKFREASNYNTYDNNLNAENFCYLAYIDYFLNNEYGKAREFMFSAYEQDSEDEWPYRLTGILLFLMEETRNYDLAIKSLRKATSISETGVVYNYLGKIYLHQAEYDSAFNAFEKAIQLDADSEFFNDYLNQMSETAILSQNPVYINKAKTHLKEQINDPNNQYPSSEAYLQLARLNRISNGSRQKFEEYIDQLFKINENIDSVYTFLEDLFLNEGDTAAFNLRISHKEALYTEESKFNEMSSLAADYLLYGDYERCISFIEEEKDKIQNKDDSVYVVYLLGYSNYRLAERALESTDSLAFQSYLEEAIPRLEYSIATYPTWEGPLSVLQYIYHEYTFDFDKSYQVSKTLIEIDSTNSGYISNYIEALFTFGKFDSVIERTEHILLTDSIGSHPLSNMEKLAVRYIVISSKILRNDLLGAYSDFGDFKRLYIETHKQKGFTWNWDGTKKYLNEYNDINLDSKNIIIQILNALENPDKEGIAKLSEIDDTWRKLILESKL